jgi:large subunit ribosomal protein L1
VEFKIDKTSNLHVPVGKIGFSLEQLAENARAVVDAVTKAKPSGARGVYLRSATLSSTMSPPLPLDLKALVSA